MRYITLNNKVKIPEIGIGTWQLTGPVCKEAVEIALRLGYRHIDTAEHYGNEAIIGEAIKNFDRKKLFITSKVWRDHYSYNGVLEAFSNSARNLGTDYLDLYLIHWPDKNADYKQMFKAFKELYNKGKIRAFGVSNFTIKHLIDSLKLCKEFNLPLTVNQVEFHPLLYQKELLEFCKKHNIVVTAYSPLARGEILKNEVMQEIGKKYNKTPAQISLRWLLDKGIVVIPKASSEKHLAANLDINFELSKEDTEKIDSLNENKRMVCPDYNEFSYS